MKESDVDEIYKERRRRELMSFCRFYGKSEDDPRFARMSSTIFRNYRFIEQTWVEYSLDNSRSDFLEDAAKVFLKAIGKDEVPNDDVPITLIGMLYCGYYITHSNPSEFIENEYKWYKSI